MSGDLALNGGAPVRTRPFAPWPVFDDAAIDAVAEVVRSGRLTYWAGEHGRTLEREYAASLGRAHGIAVSNGTLALELALRAFRIGPGDEVVVPARTFIATASAVVAVGATPVCADIDPLTGVITAETIAAVLTERSRAIIPVHLGGYPVDMAPVLALAATRDLIVIEDCAQAHGASCASTPVGGRRPGSPASHAAAFSFCQDKIVSSGEGGLLVLDDDAAYERAWSYKDHGKSFSALMDPTAAPASGSAFRWLHDSFGSNWRLPETSAVLVQAGLRALPEWHAARARNAAVLADGLASVGGLTLPALPDHGEHAYYRFYAYLNRDALAPGWDRDRVAAAVSAEGVPCAYGSCAEIYRERAFTDAGLGPSSRLPGASRAHETSLAFLVHPTLDAEDMHDIITAVTRVLAEAVQ